MLIVITCVSSGAQTTQSKQFQPLQMALEDDEVCCHSRALRLGKLGRKDLKQLIKFMVFWILLT